jgi:hypothetical protein
MPFLEEVITSLEGFLNPPREASEPEDLPADAKSIRSVDRHVEPRHSADVPLQISRSKC